MARIWKEPYDRAKHRNRMRGVEGVARDHYRAPTIVDADVYFVRVCSFTFEFHSIAQIEMTLAYYARKIQPSSRADISNLCPGFEHWEAQRWFEQLPLYLREEPKRLKVVAGLQEAIKTFKPNATPNA